MTIATPVFSKDKLVQPHEVPVTLLQKRVNVWQHMIRSGGEFPCVSFDVLKEKREWAVKEIFSKHKERLSPFFHSRVKMIGGLAGEKPDMNTLFELAMLQHQKWGAKDGNTKKVGDYLKELEMKGGPTPIFAYYLDDGKIEGAVFPVQVDVMKVTTWQNAVDNDNANGDVLICPKICSYGTVMGAGKQPVGKSLIVEGVLPYATVLAHFRIIYDLLAYSRPANYGPENRNIGIMEHLPNDPNWKKFHFQNDASLVCVVEEGVSRLDEKAGGYGFIAGYTKHLRPDEKMLFALREIATDVKLAFAA